MSAPRPTFRSPGRQGRRPDDHGFRVVYRKRSVARAARLGDARILRGLARSQAVSRLLPPTLAISMRYLSKKTGEASPASRRVDRDMARDVGASEIASTPENLEILRLETST
jgi:hypothetical protein